VLPSTIPIFPLPNVVLFPNVFLPLHVFEPRYREMVTDALAGDRIIGMVLLQPGYEHDYDGRPAVYRIGCAGVVTHSETLADGRYNMVLRGLEKFRILDEDTSHVYRLANVEPLPEIITAGEDREKLRRQRQRLEALLAAAVERGGADPKFPPSVADEDLVNALAQYLALEPVERQALLEREGISARCQGLIELLEMRTLAPPGTSWGSGAVH
jgi:Lon protease-like protein